MGFSSVQALVDAELAGQTWYSTWRKSPSQVSTIGVWFDLSMSPGNPVPQYYAASPLVGVPMSYSDEQGLMVGRNVAPATKHLKRVTVMTATATALPMPMMLLDYLFYYPFIDEGSTDEQLLDNTQSLTRYADGEGVQVMAVSVAGRTGGQTFQFSCTNSGGVAGVRSIESVTMNGADVGLFALVLVKPLAQLSLRGIDAPVEVNYFTDFGQLPTIVDDAYLNFIACPSGSLAATALHGDVTVVWN